MISNTHRTILFQGTYNIKVFGDPVPKNAISSPNYDVDTTHQQFMSFHRAVKNLVEQDRDTFTVTPDYEFRRSDVYCTLKYNEPENPKVNALGSFVKSIIPLPSVVFKSTDPLEKVAQWLESAKKAFDKHVEDLKPNAALANEICEIFQKHDCLDFVVVKKKGSDSYCNITGDEALKVLANRLMGGKKPVANKKVQEFRDCLNEIIKLNDELKEAKIVDGEYKNFNVMFALDETSAGQQYISIRLCVPPALKDDVAENLRENINGFDMIALPVRQAVIKRIKDAME